MTPEDAGCHSVELNMHSNQLCVFPAGNRAPPPEELHSSGPKIRNWLPGHRYCPVSQQCRRCCFCQKENQWVNSHACWARTLLCSPNSNDTSLTSNIGSLPGVSSLRLVQAGFFSLSLSWSRPSAPVQGYKLTYGPRGQKLLLFTVPLTTSALFTAETVGETTHKRYYRC